VRALAARGFHAAVRLASEVKGWQVDAFLENFIARLGFLSASEKQ
jgi:hypothetical protein